MWWLLCLLVGFSTPSDCFLAEDADVVETPLGKISGFQRSSRDGRTFWAWTRVPFGKPPVGKLRFAAPEPAEAWEGILNATKLPPQCHQPMKSPAAQQMSEDCLYLNVYRPKIDQKPLPVLVYLHGGGFVFGYSGSIEFAEYIMDEDVVLVTVNYRVAALGFMSMNHSAFPGNYGLKDQALAVKWVKENIEGFGGDPNSITVFGESAGGASSHMLLLSPLTRDIVSRCVSISGVITRVWSLKTPHQVAAGNRLMADGLGCSQTDPSEVVECLRELDPSKFSEYFHTNYMKSLFSSSVPVIEPEGPGAFAPTDLKEAETTKPMMLSYSVGEHHLFETRERMKGSLFAKGFAADIDGSIHPFIEGLFGLTDDERRSAIADKVKAVYFNSSDADSVFHGLSMIIQEVAFIYPAMSVAEFRKGPVWMYHMEHRGEYTLFDLAKKQNNTEPCHGDELFMLFNWRKFYPRASQHRPRKRDVRKSKELIKYIVNFAYYDNPTPEDSGLPVWKPYEGSEILRMKTGQNEMGDSNFVEKQKNLWKFWSEIVVGLTSKWV